MKDNTLRHHVAAALEAAIPFNAALAAALAAFVRGQGDCPLDVLEMDSLGYMEMCIALELSTGVELTPEDVHEAKTLVGLVTIMAARF